MPYQSTKTFGHNLGLSCCFRQWRADSHCSFLHGYAVEVKLVFEAPELDHRNWVIDFGSLKLVKKYLEDMFDHKTLVAQDDPEHSTFLELHEKKIIDMVTVPAIGCEKFSQYIYEHVDSWLVSTGESTRVKLVSCEVREHGANSAVYTGSSVVVTPTSTTSSL